MRSEALTNHAAAMQTAESLQPVSATNAPTIDPAIWVDEHGDYLFRYAVMRLRDESLAEDAVQEALLAAFQAIATYTGRSTERTCAAWNTDQRKRSEKFVHKMCDLRRFSLPVERQIRRAGLWSRLRD